MLRQIYIFHDGAIIFTHQYALGIKAEDFRQILDKIKSNPVFAMPGVTMTQPISNYQVFYKISSNAYFFFITDPIDSINYGDKLLDVIIEKFKEYFPKFDNINESNTNMESFKKLLSQIQKELHSKISIIGPFNSGKSTLYNLLKTGQERVFMDFAKVSECIIENLSFEIWDFQLDDNFSILWQKLIGNSDLVIFLFNLEKYNTNLFNHFLDLNKKEGNLSRFLLIGNKQDLVKDKDIEKIKKEIKIQDLNVISLINSNALLSVNQMIIKHLDLKDTLPLDFKNLIAEAEKLDSGRDLNAAIKKYEELIEMAKKIQAFTYITPFDSKISEFKIKLEAQKLIEASKSKYGAPKQIKFKQNVSVKSLPEINSLLKSVLIKDQASPEIKIIGKVVKPESLIPKSTKLETKTTKPPSKTKEVIKTKSTPIKKEVIKKKTTHPSLQTLKLNPEALAPKKQPIKKLSLKTEDIKSNLKLSLQKIQTREKKITILPSVEKNSEVKSDDKIIIQKMIEQRGSNLSANLCKVFISKMDTLLETPIKSEDLEMAVDYFINIEKI